MSGRAMPGAVTRERRTLLLGAGAIVAILALGRGVPAWRDALAERRERATQLHVQLAGAEHALARHGAVRDTLAARNARLQVVSASLMPGADDGAAGRALAAMVSGAAAGAEVRLTSTSVVDEPRTMARAAMGEKSASSRRAPQAATLLRPVAVRIAGTGDVRGIATLLQTLERGPARLRVRSMNVTQPDVGAADDRVEMLQLEMVVEGLAVARRDSAARPIVAGGRGASR